MSLEMKVCTKCAGKPPESDGVIQAYPREIRPSMWVFGDPEPEPNCDHCKDTGLEPCEYTSNCGRDAQVLLEGQYMCHECAAETLRNNQEHAEWEAESPEIIGEWRLVKSWDGLWIVVPALSESALCWVTAEGAVLTTSSYLTGKTWRYATKSEAATALNRYLRLKEEGK